MLAAMAVAIASCGGKEEKKEKFEIKRTTAPTQEKKETVEVPVDMNNKGVGPITSLKFDSEVDETLAKEGETLYNQKCTICHMADKKLIGPALKGIYDRRSPEWVMNMMLDPMKMLKEDTIAKALQKANNNAIMTDQGLSEEQARALAEYLRTL
ncbi:Cytochrome c [Pustulibacterium marinum]|uniref:Cytochrome c n=2 Tax=Pustulibacterium marinum TaxID=1224947 RepID=A0A1I7I8D9_9FLAO|nr:Cytochrome c [Pustulibacterium marinum]